MTVQLKSTVVRKAINEIVNTGLDRGEADLIAPILLSTRGMDINLEDGTVTLKFKPNKAMLAEPKSKTPAKSTKTKAKAKAPVADAPAFERGEKSTLKREFKENIVDYKDKGVVLKHFGQVVELGANSTPFLIVGFEDGKFVCRNAKGKDVNKPIKTVLTAIDGEAPAKPAKKTKAEKPAKTKTKAKSKAKSKSKSKEKAKKFSVEVKEIKQSPVEEKIGKKEQREAKRKFASAANKLSKDGVSADWYFKVVTVNKRRLRLVKLSASKKQFGTINIDTGKKVRLNLSDLLPL